MGIRHIYIRYHQLPYNANNAKGHLLLTNCTINHDQPPTKSNGLDTRTDQQIIINNHDTQSTTTTRNHERAPPLHDHGLHPLLPPRYREERKPPLPIQVLIALGPRSAADRWLSRPCPRILCKKVDVDQRCRATMVCNLL